MSKKAALQVQPSDTEEVGTTLVDKRSRLRHLSRQFAFSRCRPDPESTYQLVRVWNVSMDSVGLFLSHPAKPGTVFHLQFRHPATERDESFPAR